MSRLSLVVSILINAWQWQIEKDITWITYLDQNVFTVNKISLFDISCGDEL